MNFKWIGAILVIAGCGGFGFSMAASHKKTEKMLRQLISALDFMECELQYRLTPLPELCRMAAKSITGQLRNMFLFLAEELERQISPDASCCMTAALARTVDLPQNVRQRLKELGASLGHFDLPGQLNGLDAVRSACRKELEEMETDRDARLRGYGTLGLCAGAALVILFI